MHRHPTTSQQHSQHSPWLRRLFIIVMFLAYSFMLHSLSLSSSKKASWPIFGIPRSADGGPVGGGLDGSSTTVAGSGKGIERYVLGPTFRLGFASLEAPPAADEDHVGGEESGVTHDMEQQVLEAFATPGPDILIVRCVPTGEKKRRKGVAVGRCSGKEKRRMLQWLEAHGTRLGEHTEAQIAPTLFLFPDPPPPPPPTSGEEAGGGIVHLEEKHHQQVLPGTSSSVFLQTVDSILSDPRQLVLSFSLLTGGSVGQYLRERFAPAALAAAASNKRRLEEDVQAIGQVMHVDRQLINVGGEAGNVRQSQIVLGYQKPTTRFSANLRAAVSNPDTSFSPLLVVTADAAEADIHKHAPRDDKNRIGINSLSSGGATSQFLQFGLHVQLPSKVFKLVVEPGTIEDADDREANVVKSSNPTAAGGVLVVDVCPSTDSVTVVSTPQA